jgi:dephospho-CoA kinase
MKMNGRPSAVMVVVAGYPGSGKTECGKFISSKTGWPLLDKDTLTRPLVDNGAMAQESLADQAARTAGRLAAT